MFIPFTSSHLVKQRDMSPLLPLIVSLRSVDVGYGLSLSHRFINTRSEDVNLTVGDHDFYVASDYSISANKTVDRKE